MEGGAATDRPVGATPAAARLGLTRVRARRMLVGLTAAAVVLVVVSALRLAVTAEPVGLARVSDRRVWAVAVVFTVIGARVVSRRPRNAVGWLLFAMGLSGTLTVTAAGFGDLGPAVAWVVQWAWWPTYGLLPMLLLLFPDGRLPSPRWRPVWWVAVAGAVAPTALFAVAAVWHPGDLFLTDEASADPARRFVVAGAAGVAAAVVATAGGVAAVIARWRNASGEARLQLKWLLAAGVLAVTAAALDALWSLPGAWLVDTIALPAAIGVAILRYHLYGIDVVIHRSLVYAALTAAVIAVYAGIVTVLGLVIERSGLVVPLVATGVVAVVFQPLRVWLQRGVNRLLYGRRDEPYEVLSQLGQRLAATLEPQAELQSVVSTIAEALKLPYVAIELPRRDGFEAEASIGQRTGEPLRIPLVHQGETVGKLAVAPRARGEALTPADLRLLDDVARHAGVAVHAARLTADLQRSRERLVNAREEERRRVRRDLHDGLGPVLSGIVLQLGAVKTLLGQDPDRAVTLVERLQGEAKTAVADIRTLIYALRPPQLDELGLVGALREHAATLTTGGGVPGPDVLTATVQAPASMPELPAAVEVAAYRIATEALTNVARHADARHCQVRLTLTRGLELEVRDDGTGLPDGYRAGVGLTSMRERAAELGGTCDIRPVTGGGTSVRARLPLLPRQP